MKSSVSVLYPNDGVAAKVTAYSETHSTPLPEHIVKYHDQIDKANPMANYMISNFQAQSGIWLAHLIGAKRILEIGVYVGYSSLSWAHAVGPDGKVTGLEFNPEYAKRAEEAFAANGVKNVEILIGDGLETLPKLNPEQPYDLIFIDAQKSGYPAYLATILEKSQPGASNRLLRAGGLIIADNVLRRGIVADDSDENPYALRERLEAEKSKLRSEYWQSDDIVKLKEFNKRLATDPRLDAWLMPLYDGVGLARLID